MSARTGTRSTGRWWRPKRWTTSRRRWRIDTTNPPGNETEVAVYLRDALAAEGVAGRLYAMVPGRDNFVARVRGNGSKEPVLVMGHTDVVGVQRENWSVEPF